MSDKQLQYSDGQVVQETRPELRKPTLYKVILLNDDYTPMEFVVVVLEKFFRKNRAWVFVVSTPARWQRPRSGR